MTDCRTCKHNIYGPKIDDWVSCGHPETIAQMPRPTASDPAWVNFMTADMRVGDMLKMFASHGPCATHEAHGGQEYRRADLPPTLSADLIRLRAEVATLRASEARMREALERAETTIADLERSNASYQSALSERGIDGSKGTEE